MRAGELARPMSTVTEDVPAAEAVRVLAARDLPGLVVVDRRGRPLTVLAGTQVLRMSPPAYCRDDPALARVVEDDAADVILEGLARSNVPLVAVVGADKAMAGAITLDALLGS
jgi:CBS domain protein